MSPSLPRAAVDVRPARPDDVPAMIDLMEPFVTVGDLLPRTPVEVLRDVGAYVVAVDADGVLVGTGSLKRYSPGLAEVQALAVSPAAQGAGVGRSVVERLLVAARDAGIGEIFALTRRPQFFARIGFRAADKHRFPSKIWLDCARCPRQDACDEIAVHLLLAD